MTTQLKSLHALWNKLTGQDLKYLPCERLLWEYLNTGFTEADLNTVLTFMLWQNRKREPKYRDRIQFHRIVGDLEVFNSRLGEARAWERNRVKSATEKQKVLDQFRGAAQPSDTSDNTRRWGDVLQAIKQP